MDRPYVKRLHLENYGCIREATFKLTPLHALIGPNDSGKSTALRALRTLALLRGRGRGVPEREDLLRIMAMSGVVKPVLAEAATDQFGIEISFRPRAGSSAALLTYEHGHRRGSATPLGLWDGSLIGDTPNSLEAALNGSELFRLDPDALRAPNALIQDGQSLRFLDERGTGLAAIYDAIMVRDLPAFLKLNERLCELFPNVMSISPINSSSSKKAIGVKLVDGTFVPAKLMSEGLLYYLAFAAIPHLDPTAILLIEEPENGLHPARIAEVMRVLREISKTTQVLIATHSPLVINELQGDEVTVVTRTREHGTKATLLKDTPNFEERSKVYALGELWVSYANGQDEAPLLEGGPRP